MVAKSKAKARRTARSDGSTGRGGQAGEDAGRTGEVRKRSVKKKRRRWPLVVALCVLAALVLVTAAFSWQRWLRYDDAADFQGAWQVPAAENPVVIDNVKIVLTDEVSYHYRIDPFAKTISYEFGDLAGGGHYRFSADRSTLVIEENGDWWWLTTLFDDIAAGWGDVVRAAQGLPPEVPTASEGVTVLVRPGTAAAAGDAAAGEAPVDPAPEPAPEPEPAPAPEPEPAPAPEGSASQGDADPGVPATPSETFDVNDVAAP